MLKFAALMAKSLMNNLWKVHQKILNYSENNEIFVRGGCFLATPCTSIWQTENWKKTYTNASSVFFTSCNIVSNLTTSFQCQLSWNKQNKMIKLLFADKNIHVMALFWDYTGEPVSLCLVEQETVSGSGISWAICKSAPCPRQITMPSPHHSVFYRLDALPAAQPTGLKHYLLINADISA